jgi:hypothetical protein
MHSKCAAVTNGEMHHCAFGSCVVDGARIETFPAALRNTAPMERILA